MNPISNAIGRAAHHVASNVRHLVSPQQRPFTAPRVAAAAPRRRDAEQGTDVRIGQTRDLMRLLATNPDRRVPALFDTVHGAGAQFSLREVNARQSNLLHVLATTSDEAAFRALVSQMLSPDGGYSQAEILDACNAPNAAGQTPEKAAREAGYGLRATQLLALQGRAMERLGQLPTGMINSMAAAMNAQRQGFIR